MDVEGLMRENRYVHRQRGKSVVSVSVSRKMPVVHTGRARM